MKKKRYLKPATKFIMLKPHSFIAVSEDKIVPENNKDEKEVTLDNNNEYWPVTITKSDDIW